jgi:hypothetical protein
MCRKCDSFPGLSPHFCSLHKITMRLFQRPTIAIIRAIAFAKLERKPRASNSKTHQIFHIPRSNNWKSVLSKTVPDATLSAPKVSQFSRHIRSHINSSSVIISLELRFHTNHSGGKSCSATLEPACAINFPSLAGIVQSGCWAGSRGRTSI